MEKLKRTGHKIFTRVNLKHIQGRILKKNKERSIDFLRLIKNCLTKVVRKILKNATITCIFQ